MKSSKAISIVIASIGIVLSITAGLFIAGIANTRQIFLVVFGLVAFIVIFARLEWGVVAMIFILYTQTYIIVGERYGLTNLIQGLILLLLLSMGTRWIVYSDEIPRGWMRPLFLVLFYCMMALSSVLYADNSIVAMPVAIETFKSGFIALIIAVVIKTEKSFRLAIWTLLIIGIFLGTLSVYQFLTETYNNDYGGFAIAGIYNIAGQTNDYRLGGPVGDPNYYAQMMLVLVPLALDRLWNEKHKALRIFAAWALGVCSLTVLLTYSRGGLVAMIFAVGAMVFIFHRGQFRYALAALIIGLILINIIPSRFSERLSTFTELVPGLSNSTAATQDSSFRGRTSEMLVAIQMFVDHPVFGVGVGNYPVLYQTYSRRLGIDPRAEVRQAHSLYLEVVSETGLLGFFSFMLLLWVVLRSLFGAQRSLAQRGLTSISNIIAAYSFGFIGYLIAALFIHSAYPRNFWVLAGIALSIPRFAAIEIESLESLKRRAILSDHSPSVSGRQ